MDGRLYGGTINHSVTMERYIALLRGINVGGQKKILMADLKALFESVGCTEVSTYIQSGNVVFSSTELIVNVSSLITNAIEDKYGWNVPVLVKKGSELAKIIQNCPFSHEIRRKSYFVLLHENPSATTINATSGLSHVDETFSIASDCVYIHYSQGAGKAKMGNNFFEKKLKVVATSRNYRTMAKLVEISKQ